MPSRVVPEAHRLDGEVVVPAFGPAALVLGERPARAAEDEGVADGVGVAFLDALLAAENEAVRMGGGVEAGV